MAKPRFEFEFGLGIFKPNLKFEFEFENSQTPGFETPGFENFQTPRFQTQTCLKPKPKPKIRGVWPSLNTMLPVPVEGMHY